MNYRFRFLVVSALLLFPLALLPSWANFLHPIDYLQNLLSDPVKKTIDQASKAEETDDALSTYAQKLAEALKNNPDDLTKGSLLLRIYYHCMEVYKKPRMARELLRVALEHNADPNILGRKQANIALSLIANDDGETLDILHEYTDELTAHDSNGYNLLQLAVVNQKQAVLKRLLAQSLWKTQVNIPLSNGDSLLGTAIQASNVMLVQTLLDHAADPNLAYGKEAKTVPLIQAIKQENNDIVTLLLEAGAQVNVTYKGNTPLLHAASIGNNTLVRALIDKKADINVMNNQYQSPLLLTIDRLCKEMDERKRAELLVLVEYMLQKGASINIKDAQQQTALIKACNAGLDQLITLIFKFSPNINATDSLKNTALNCAIKSNNEKVVAQLLNNGASINHTNYCGETPLINAIQEKNNNIIQLLLEKGANSEYIDPKGNTIWHHFIMSKAIIGSKKLFAITRHLINVKNNDGNTPLHLAAQLANAPAAQFLLAQGATLIPNKEEQTALHIAAFDSNSYPIMELILNRPLSNTILDAPDKNGNTAVHLAAMRGNSKGLRLLIQHHACLNNINNRGETPFIICCKSCSNVKDTLQPLAETTSVTPNKQDNDGYAGIHHIAKTGDVQKLKEFIAVMKQANKKRGQQYIDVNRAHKTTKQTALHMVTEQERLECIELLLEAGADVNALDKNKETSLHIATRKRNAAICTLLLTKLPDTNGYNKDTQTPLHIALEHQADQCIYRLITYPKIDVNKEDSKHHTPLWYAFNTPSPVYYTKLLFQNQHAEPNKLSESEWSLHVAFDKQQFDLIQLLLAHPRIDLESKQEGKTIWERAIEAKYIDQLLEATHRAYKNSSHTQQTRLGAKIKALYDAKNGGPQPSTNPEVNKNDHEKKEEATPALVSSAYAQPSAPVEKIPAYNPEAYNEDGSEKNNPPAYNPGWDGK